MSGRRHMTRIGRGFLLAACGGAFLLAGAVAAPQAAAAVEAITVPWVPANQAVPHPTYSGAQTRLKGIARGGATQYRWDFGDGGSTAWTNIGNAYNLGVGHVYTGTPGQLFAATLWVRNGAGEEDSDSYPIKLFESTDLRNNAHLDVRINKAIDDGLWYLHVNMNRYTYGGGAPGYGQPYGYQNGSYGSYATCAAVDAFQLHGSKVHLDYDSDPYVETVQRGLNYVLYNTRRINIGNQAAGNPDTNENGYGLYTLSTNTYVGGICSVAVASSGAPNRKIGVGTAEVYDRTYAEVVQDVVDYYAWGQSEGAWGRGGWHYGHNYGSSDMSTTQWPVLALYAAEENMGSTVPAFVRSELVSWMNYTYNGAGTWGYSSKGSYLNLTKTGAGMILHEWRGEVGHARVARALGYIYAHWNDGGASWASTKLRGNSYGMYGIMKAMRLPEPDITRVTNYDKTADFDWYYYPAGQSQVGLAYDLVTRQQADGSWDDNVGANRLYDSFATAWDVMVLMKGVTIIPPTAEVCDCDEQEYMPDQDITMNGSCSMHTDKNRSVVGYEWDIDNDDVFEESGVNLTIAGGLPYGGVLPYTEYPVTLRVTDDNPDNLGGPQTATHTCVVKVHPPPHCPHAFAGGPYEGWVGVPVELDGSASWDPDGEDLLYEWDLDNDGDFDDAQGELAPWTFHSEFEGVIGLRVTDSDTGDGVACADIDYATVAIGNHAPVAVPGGPYSGGAGATIALDGSGSFDSDPGDEITFAWDLDNDGEFDDGIDAEAGFTIPGGAVPGASYDVCLKVTDLSGEYGSACTTVTVVDNSPPVALCQDVTLTADAQCSACGSIDNGSWDPDDDPITLDQAPECFGLGGPTAATLTVSDGQATTSCGAEVTVVDATAPAIECPANLTQECPAATGPEATGTADAADNCGVEAVSYDDATAAGCGPTEVITRTWSASDGAGNGAVCVQTIAEADTTEPDIECPTGVATEADAACLGHVDLEAPVVADDCDPSLTVNDDSPADYPLGDTTVTHTVADTCGNSSSCGQVVTVIDVTPPTIECNTHDILPGDVPVTFTATADDNCLVEYAITGYDCWRLNGAGKIVHPGCDVVIDGDTITVLDSGGVDDNIEWTVLATDGSGNETEVTCASHVGDPGNGGGGANGDGNNGHGNDPDGVDESNPGNGGGKGGGKGKKK